MVTGSHHKRRPGMTGAFFLSTLLLWFVSVCFEILFHKRTELLPLLAGCCFYQSANWILRLWVSRDPLFLNTCVSLLHSSITSASVVFILVNHWMATGSAYMFDHSQLYGGTWAWAYPALCFSCGYFAYDQLDMLQHGLYKGRIPGILVHHLILLLCFTLALYRNVTINYLILTLICELHSIFLHARKVRRMSGARRGATAKAEWVMNWLTFLMARVGAHLLIMIKLIKDARRFERGTELGVAVCGMVGMNLLNLRLGMDLMKAYGRDRKQMRHR